MRQFKVVIQSVCVGSAGGGGKSKLNGGVGDPQQAAQATVTCNHFSLATDMYGG